MSAQTQSNFSPSPAFWDKAKLLCQSDDEFLIARRIVAPYLTEEQAMPRDAIERQLLATIDTNLRFQRQNGETCLDCVPLLYRGGWRTLAEISPGLQGRIKTLGNWALCLARNIRVDHGWWLSGPIGTGKTGLARGIQVFLLERGMTDVRCHNCADLFRALKNSYNEPGGSREYLRPLASCKLLILDDLGAGNMSDADRGALLALADSRYEARMPMVVTSNYRLDLVAKSAKTAEMQRAADRWRESLQEINLDGPSLRGGRKEDEGEDYWSEKQREFSQDRAA